MEKLAKPGHGPHSSQLFVICVVLLLFVLFYELSVLMSFHVLFVCKCVLYHCHRLLTQLQLTNISYHISYRIISHHITSHNITYHITSHQTVSYIISYIISYHIISHHIIYHITSYHITSYRIVSYIT